MPVDRFSGELFGDPVEAQKRADRDNPPETLATRRAQLYARDGGKVNLSEVISKVAKDSE